MAKLLVSFDLDGVIMQNPFGKGVFPEVQQRLAPYVDSNRLSDQDARSYVQRRIVDTAAALVRRGEWRAAYDWDAIVMAVARELGSPEAFDVAAIVRKYCIPGYIDTYPDVVPTLQWLRERRAHLAWVSNGFASYQQPVLDALGLAPLFDDYAAPDRMGGVKPETSIFHHVRPADATLCVHVGDMLAHDVNGALRSGFVAVWLDRKLPEEFRTIDVPARTQAPGMDAYITERVAKEFCWEAYNLEVPKDVRPHYIIHTLEELHSVLADLEP